MNDETITTIILVVVAVGCLIVGCAAGCSGGREEIRAEAVARGHARVRMSSQRLGQNEGVFEWCKRGQDEPKPAPKDDDQ